VILPAPRGLSPAEEREPRPSCLSTKPSTNEPLMKTTIAIIGAGPGLGLASARRFGAEDLSSYLSSIVGLLSAFFYPISRRRGRLGWAVDQFAIHASPGASFSSAQHALHPLGTQEPANSTRHVGLRGLLDSPRYGPPWSVGPVVNLRTRWPVELGRPSPWPLNGRRRQRSSTARPWRRGGWSGISGCCTTR
jgi:hypothetical protein